MKNSYIEESDDFFSVTYNSGEEETGKNCCECYTEDLGTHEDHNEANSK